MATQSYFTLTFGRTQDPKSGYAFLESALDELEQLPSVQRFIRTVVKAQTRARPGYSPRIMWRAVCLKHLLGERFVVGFLERLKSSPKLTELCGFKGTLPSDSTFSRFFTRLADAGETTDIAMAELVTKLKGILPDLGDEVAIDSTDIEAYAKDRTPPSDPDAAWGYRTPKTKSKAKDDKELFFGYKMHSVSDVKYGAPLAHTVLPANKNDSPQLPGVVAKAQKLLPRLKPNHLMADRGYDSQANHSFLIKRGIVPIIHIRKPTADDGLYDGLYTAKGAPTCDGKTPMKYVRTDSNGHHVFRCPPKGCSLRKRSRLFAQYCNTMDHREDPADNYRVLGAVSRLDPRWQKLYSKRTVIERMFGSLKRMRLLDQHQFRRAAKVVVHIGLANLTYLVTMFVRVRAGDMKRIRHMRIGLGV